MLHPLDDHIELKINPKFDMQIYEMKCAINICREDQNNKFSRLFKIRFGGVMSHHNKDNIKIIKWILIYVKI